MSDGCSNDKIHCEHGTFLRDDICLLCSLSDLTLADNDEARKAIMTKMYTFKNHNRKGTLHCSLHGIVTSEISEGEVPECCENHKKAGCPLALTWKSSTSYGYRG